MMMHWWINVINLGLDLAVEVTPLKCLGVANFTGTVVVAMV